MEIVVKLDSCTHYDNGCQSADAVVVVVVAEILGLSFNPNVRLVVETESTSV